MVSVKKNYLYQVLYEISSIIIPLITAPYVTRVLGASNLGVFSYTQSIANLFLSLARLGIVNHGSRSIAAVQNDRYLRSKIFSRIYCVQFIFASLVTIMYVSYAIFFIENNTTIALIQTIWVSVAIFDIAWVFGGIENFKLTVIRGITIKLVTLILLFVIVRNENDLWKYTLIMTGGMLLGNLILWKSWHKYFDFIKPKINEVLLEIKPLIILFIPTIAVTIYTTMDKIMLGSISGEIYTAYYEYSSKLVAIPMGFITSFGLVMLPRMSAMSANGIDYSKQQQTITNSLIFVMFLSSAFSFGLAAISDVLIPLYYGSAFLSCVLLMKIIAIKLPAMAWANVIRTQILIPQHKNKLYIFSLFVGASVNLVLNFILIKNYKDIGVAIATVLSEITVCLIQSFFIEDKKVLIKPFMVSVLFILNGLIMYCVVTLFSNVIPLKGVLLLVLEVLIGATYYFCASLLIISKFILRKSICQTINIFKKNLIH
ncbi:oligosaccharide flippase family protein [Anaerorhabdus sp.]|uniref:oligosaccharide flippase family protein n=1 Tax=Anaerorhabdus sp. TaxID=1872524 RepID=UPI002FC891ED